jgi:hypothetical protein
MKEKEIPDSIKEAANAVSVYIKLSEDESRSDIKKLISSINANTYTLMLLGYGIEQAINDK